MVGAQLTNEQAVVRNADGFRSKLAILDKAAVGVILCRTREPYRALDTIKDYAFGEDVECRLWTVLYGWAKYNKADPTAAPQVDNLKEINGALMAIGDIAGSTTGFPNGFYAMMYAHFWLKPGQANPVTIQIIKEYCRLFTQNEKRLILLAPLGYSLPQELEEDVLILDFDTPSHAEMGDIYDVVMEGFGDKKPNFNKDAKNRTLAAAAGMSQQEFETSLSRAVVTHRKHLPNVDPDLIIGEVMQSKVEVVKRSEVLEVMEATNMSNVGGLENLKEWLRKRAPTFGEDAKKFGIDAPKGMALIGPPGTGKSLCAKATANLLGLPLIKFDISRVFQSLVGQSEERVRAALKMLDAMAPCVVMLDEVDKAFQMGSGGDSGVSQRILGLILTHMQETHAPLFWVASANRVDNLPSEFLRRGRLDEVFSVSVPEDDERLDIIKIHLRKRGQDPDKIKDLDVAVQKSNGYVPAELEAAVKDALIDAFSDNIPVTGELIGKQLGNMKPLSVAFAEQFQRMTEWADNNARPASKSKEEKVAVRARSRTAPAVASSGKRAGMSLDS
ncbi:AAA+ family ATPase [Rhizobium phage vB_RleS_L338C]|uniref:AAA+ family ATPase n=1 Tax=Rhizobium phage vB_RleS_L338C TaxID=1414737 RepID=UPI0003D7E1F9|nr:AAA+ family ATPase [Rhizobium phage vB_RleS_L338C]AHC30467.1 AAA+ family ATPase [Rhizobium phage vB_RleS_L338C]QNH72044.1 AAA+ family ATPase [Rhizobium phage P11VFA]